MLFVVEEQPSGPLGLAAGSLAVRSARSAYEKPPWKNLAPVEGVVESDFVRRLYLGESVLPFRLLPPRLAVIPLDGARLLDGDSDRIDLYPGLAAWWRTAEQLWVAHRSSDRLTLIKQLDYRRKLSGQFPAQRIVYSKAGMHLAAARIDDPSAVIDHTLYWAAAASEDEVLYLCAVMNSPKTTELVRPFMSYGKDERHIDKYVWRLPIPLFDPHDPTHQRLAVLGRAAEEEIAALDLYEGGHFPALRRRIRQHLATTSVGVEINDLVTALVTARLERGGVSSP